MTDATAMATHDPGFRDLQRQLWRSGTDVLRALTDRGDATLSEVGAARQAVRDTLERQEESMCTLLANLTSQIPADEASGIAAQVLVTRWIRLHRTFWEQWFHGMEALRVVGPQAAGLSESDLVRALEMVRDAAEN
jgi:hypothetical protein